MEKGFVTSFILFLLLAVLGCESGVERRPSSAIEGSSCSQLMLPIIEEFQGLKASDWEVSTLAEKGLLKEDDYHLMRGDEDWQKFISRENQSDEEREMGFVVLSMLRKRFPKVDDARLRDRYRVLMAFCGR